MARKLIPKQKVVVELSNGKRGVFEGPAIVWPDDVRVTEVVNVMFMAPTIGNPNNVTPPKNENSDAEKAAGKTEGSTHQDPPKEGAAGVDKAKRRTRKPRSGGGDRPAGADGGGATKG